jgi:hypothetical protein
VLHSGAPAGDAPPLVRAAADHPVR